MDKDFLIDYEMREREYLDKYKSAFKSGTIAYSDIFSVSHRLKLKEPYTKSIIGEQIWNQIPLYETIILQLKPTRKEIFEEVHGFQISDIDRLVDFAKETGRIQFVLDEHATRYQNMDFIEVILQELKPPKLSRTPLDWLTTQEEKERLCKDVEDLLSEPQIEEFIKNFSKNKYLDYESGYRTSRKGLAKDLVRLKLLGCKDIIDFIRNLESFDHYKYIFIQDELEDLFLYPFSPLEGIISFKKQDIDKLQSNFFKNFENKYHFNANIEYPCEVGKILNKNLKLITPKSFDGALELSDRYELYDLRLLMGILEQNVKEGKSREICSNVEEIERIFNSLWDDANHLKNKINYAKYAISFGIGIIVGIATMPIGGLGGLIAGLGFNVADKFMETRTRTYESISEKIVKRMNETRTMVMYDFRKKYNLF